MFFLRCAFFLSIVYSSMSWTNSALPSHGSSTHVASLHAASLQDAVLVPQADPTRFVARAVAGATDLCARHAEECLADATRLTALFASSESAAAAGPGDRDVSARPAPNPRRRARDAKLARAS